MDPKTTKRWTLGELQAKREEILAIAARHGAYNVRIFGSVARGEATDTSDVDILIDYEPEHRPPWFPAGLVLDLKALLGCEVDVAAVSWLKERIREQILREAIPL